MDIKWTTEAVETKALEMIQMWEPHCTTDTEKVFANHLAYLTASHLQLQEAYRVNVGSVDKQHKAIIATAGLSAR